MKLFIAYLLISLSSFAEKINLDEHYDNIGEGTLSRGVLNRDEVAIDDIIEMDVCVPRKNVDADNNDILEFDFLGRANVFPSDFHFTSKALEQNKTKLGTLYRKYLPEKGKNFWGPLFSRHVCRNYGEALSGQLHFIHNKESVVIRWQAQCAQDPLDIQRFYQLSCKKDPEAIRKYK